MEYTQLILFAMGIVGILLHNLVKLDSINRANDGVINLRKYLVQERFSILISIIVVGACVIASKEIKQLAIAGKYLALGYLAIGYVAQSLLVKFISIVQTKTKIK